MSRVRPGPGALCRETTKWTRDVLSDDSRAFISRLPRLIVDGELVIAHGSLADPQVAAPQCVRRCPTTATESGLALICNATFLEGKNV